jgi:hypothetical protein
METGRNEDGRNNEKRCKRVFELKAYSHDDVGVNVVIAGLGQRFE